MKQFYTLCVVAFQLLSIVSASPVAEEALVDTCTCSKQRFLEIWIRLSTITSQGAGITMTSSINLSMFATHIDYPSRSSIDAFPVTPLTTLTSRISSPTVLSH